MKVKPMIATGLILTLVGWIGMMVSFWLPGVAHEALLSTSLALLLPGLGLTIVPWVFWREIEDYEPTAKPKPIRCMDCGTAVLNAAGATMGDQIEGEVMMLGDPDRRHAGGF
jgi:hypothetical protein